MNKEVNNRPNDNIAYCPLSNDSEVKRLENGSLSIHDKEISEEATKYLISEQPIGCKIIALRLHHLEQGQKKILRTIAGLHPIVHSERMAHNRKGNRIPFFYT